MAFFMELLLIGILGLYIYKEYSNPIWMSGKPSFDIVGGLTNMRIRVKIPVFSKLPFSIPIKSANGVLYWGNKRVGEVYANPGSLPSGQSDLFVYANPELIGNTLIYIIDLIKSGNIKDLKIDAKLVIEKGGITKVIPIKRKLL